MTKKKTPDALTRRGNHRQSRAKRKADPKTLRGKSTTPDGLTSAQVDVLCVLLNGKTQEEAASLTGVSRSGVRYMLTVPAFKAALEKARANLREKAQVDAEGLISELMPVATLDVRGLFTDTGALLPMSQWPVGIGKAVCSLETDEIQVGEGEKKKTVGYVRKIKFWPKVDAIDKLAKLIDAYKTSDQVPTIQLGVVVVPAKTIAAANDIGKAPLEHKGPSPVKPITSAFRLIRTPNG